MRVRLTFGAKAGELVELPVLSARAMLADGRAVAEGAAAPAVASPVVPPDRVDAREDRGMPRGKRRAVR